MAKSKFFRVAVSGPTIDGRTIDAAQLEQAAKNYNPDTYAARGNLEHIRGITGEGPFTALADVLALKTEPVTIDVAGKQETRVGLFAQIEPTADLIKLNRDKQKLYTSIEIIPDFSKTGTSYMVGLAFTDSPASLGTDRLQFTSQAKLYGNLISEPQPVDIAFEDDAAAVAQAEANGLINGLKEVFSGLFPPPKVEQKPVETPPAATPDMAAFTAAMTTGFTKLGEAIAASNIANTAAVKVVSDELAAFKAEVNKTPNSTYTKRPEHAGGSGAILADC